MKTAVVTGANRGIGMELCRQLAQRGWRVVAACRRAAPALEALGATVVEGIEVTDPASLERLAARLQGQRVDLLVNNAGILTRETLEDLDFDRMRAQVEINAFGPLRVTKALLPNLSSGSKVVILSSRMGSLGDNSSGGHYGYRLSKAAASMVGVNLAHDLRPKGIAVFVLHPGMVATDMTGGRGIPPAESASNLLARIEEMGMDQSGTFHHASGERLPW